MEYKKTICSLLLILPFLGVLAACSKEEIVINLLDDVDFWGEIKKTGNSENNYYNELEGDGEYYYPMP